MLAGGLTVRCVGIFGCVKIAKMDVLIHLYNGPPFLLIFFPTNPL